MATSEKKQTLKQVQADAARLTERRLEDDGFEPHYPNGYMTDMAEREATEPNEELHPATKLGSSPAVKKEQTNEKEGGK